ncbi:acetyl-CoA synthetase-like protein [Hypoxylon sp. FL1857]|nr:acetyl-CoA synthetase-like protein [Hypoxylon sp. FL1857]
MDQSLTEHAHVCLQELLKKEAESPVPANLLFYPLGCAPSPPTKVSYSTLYHEASKNSLQLAGLTNFRAGVPVLLYMNDHWDSILWFWTVLLAGGIPIPSPPLSNLESHRQKHLQNLSELLQSPICLIRGISLCNFAVNNHTLDVHTIESLLSCAPGSTTPQVKPIREKLDQQAAYQNSRLDPSSLAALMLTSGSSGDAKAVRLTHRQILSAVSGKASVRRLPEKGAFLNWIGLDHVASLIEIHIQALWLGVDQVHVHAADVVASPRLFLDLLSRHRVSRSFAPNFFLAKLVAACPRDDGLECDLSNLTFLASGGEANDVPTCVAVTELLMRYGAPRNVITTGFGMTETCAGAIYNTACPDHDVVAGRSIASLGRCMPGIEMRVTGSAPGEVGDLELRGAVIFDGYYRNPVASAEAFTPDGWFRTGDRASIDSEGNLSLAGRLKDVINIHGVKIATADLQASLEISLKDTCVAQILCFPSRAPGAASEQVTVAYIPTEWALSVEDLVETDRLAIEACMMVSTACRPVVFCISQNSMSLLPTTTLGKISSAKLRAMFEDGLFDEYVAHHNRIISDFRQQQKLRNLANADINETEAILCLDFAETMGVENVADIDLDSSLFELGFTSMDLIRLKVQLDTRLGVTVDTALLLKHPSVRSMASALDRLVQGKASNAKYHSLKTGLPTGDELYDPVVTLLGKGIKTPLWLIHPGIGEVLVFIGLVQHMITDDRPIYALRARGLEPGQSSFTSVGEAVDTYVASLRQRQPRGPYAIAGYSYGAMIAFEMTKRLEGEGAVGEEGVRFLGSFNLPPHIKDRMRQLEWNMCLLHLAQFLGLITESYADEQILTDQSPYRHASRDDALEIIMQLAGDVRMGELGLTVQDLLRWANVAHALPSLALEYEPTGCVDTLDVFHAEPLKVIGVTRHQWVSERLDRWRDFCRTEPRFHEVGGTHYTMIGPEHVLDFSRQLREALERRGL